MQTSDIYWLAGVLEGEGSFRNNTGSKGSPGIVLSMTDFDVVAKANILLKAHKIRKEIRSHRGFKDAFTIAVGGTTAAGWMMTLYPLMGERRKKRIKECLTTWKSVPPTRSVKGSKWCYKGHEKAGDNLLVQPNGKRYCRACKRQNYANRKNRLREVMPDESSKFHPDQRRVPKTS